jgi:diguanylate cyclase (GGDEF)-like protein/PAS domain S-box-containing protein
MGPIEDPDTAMLMREHELLLEFMYLCPYGVLQIDAAGDVMMANPAVARLLLPLAPTMALTNIYDILEDVAPDLRSLVTAFPGDGGMICEGRRVHVGPAEDGEPRYLALTVVKVDAERWMVVVSDISREVAHEQRLAQAHSWFAAMTAGVNDFGLLTVDGGGRITGWSDSAVRQNGYQPADMLGRTLNMLYLPEDAVEGRAAQQIAFARRDGWHIDEGWRKRKDGSRYWCQSLVSYKADGDGDAFSVVLRHVGERTGGLAELRNRLTQDHLTDVFNRAHFFETAQAQMLRLDAVAGPVSALMIDADHFKAINDTYGHATGDQVLKELAGTLKRYLRPVDILGRIGGEEFALLLPGLDLEAARLVAASLRGQIALMRIPVGTGVVRLSVSIGCSARDADNTTLEQVLAAADRALYRAKALGRDRIVTYPECREAEQAARAAREGSPGAEVVALDFGRRRRVL